MEEINKRMIIVVLVFVIIALVVIVKMNYICFANGSSIRKTIDSTAYNTVVVSSLGGNVCGDNGKDILAYYCTNNDIRWDAKCARMNENNAKSLDSLIYYLDKYYINQNNGMSYSSIIKSAYRTNSRYKLLMKNVSYEDVMRIKEFPVFRNENGGLIIEKHNRMKYINDKIGTRTIGKTSLDDGDDQKNVGIIGAYRNILKGDTVKMDVFKAYHSYEIPVRVADNLFPGIGCDVVTTLNFDLSECVYNALIRELQRSKASMGCAVVMDVKTGDIKAMINLTRRSDDENDTSYAETYNNALGYSYEPGSVFKLASFIVGMKDGLIDVNNLVTIGNGRMAFPGKDVVDSHPYKSNQTWTVTKIFAQSSNVGAAKLIYDNYKDQPQKFVDGLHKLHIDDSLKLDVISTTHSHIKNTNSNDWWETSLYQMAQGYEVMITPINIAMFYNAIANDGVMMKPRFVKEIRGNNKFQNKVNNLVVIDTICSKYVAEKAQNLLREVVASGTAYDVFKGASYEFCGKTGTAQIRATNVYNATFVGYFPANNPKYTIMVLASGLHNIYYASDVAAPVVREIADKIYSTDPFFFNSINVDAKTPYVMHRLSVLK